jgi:anti-sigma regulatory factor (Ser/Thr protein kinase)
MILLVSEDQLTRAQRELRVRLAADAASVPGARRFVAEGLRTWGHDSLVDDATLCVSELAGNAALHGNGSYIEVSVHDLAHAVRLCVEDDGAAPASAVTPRTSLPGLDDAFDAELDELDRLLSAPATGRGLAIVSVLASDWGVEELDPGKRVWAELCAGDRADDASDGPAPTASHLLGATPHTDPESALPDGWRVVRLVGCPVELSLRQDQHLDELVRELSLMSVDKENSESADLVRRLEAVLHTPAHARLAGRRQAQEALQRGEGAVDVHMAMPRDFSSSVRRLDEAVREADRLCDEQRLLTLSSPAEIRRFRAWMTEEIVRQVEEDAAPRSWDSWLAER